MKMQVEDSAVADGEGEALPEAGNGTKQERTYTAEDLERAKRGIIKQQLAAQKRSEALEAEISELRRAQAEADRKKAEASGEHEKLWRQEREAREAIERERDAHRAKLADLEARETARRERYSEKADELIKRLPKDARRLVPAALDADPEAKLDHVQALIETLSAQDTSDGIFGSGIRPPQPEMTKAEAERNRQERMLAKMMGKDPDKKERK